MPRPVSWLPRLHEIRKSVTASVRSHYDRHDLEQLFELQPRAAQKLLEMLPSIRVGSSRLVEREVMANFLNRVHEAEDVPALLEVVRQEKASDSRKKIRSLIRRDVAAVGIGALPECIELSRGRLEVRFQTIEELAAAMLTLARVLENDGDAFAQQYEAHTEKIEDLASVEVRRLFASLGQNSQVSQG